MLVMIKTTFFLRSNNDASKSRVLYLRVTYNGTSSEISTGEKIDPKDWSQAKQKMTSGTQFQREYVSGLVTSLTYALKEAALFYKPPTVKKLIEIALKPKPEPCLVDIVRQYIDHRKNNVASGTHKNDLVKLNNLTEFDPKNEYTAANFTYSAARDFIEWFKKTRGTTNDTCASRNVEFCVSALNFAITAGIIESHRITAYTGRRDPAKEVVYLTEKEVQRLINKKLSSPFLRNVRDVFIFQCYTGMSYVDLKSWTISGQLITGRRKKNGNPYWIPVDPVVKEILKDHRNKLPVYSNAVYNRIIKEVVSLCGINKNVTTHTGRKTFASMMDARGWTREAIAQMLGHRSIRTTEQFYLGESGQRVTMELMTRTA